MEVRKEIEKCMIEQSFFEDLGAVIHVHILRYACQNTSCSCTHACTAYALVHTSTNTLVCLHACIGGTDGGRKRRRAASMLHAHTTVRGRARRQILAQVAILAASGQQAGGEPGQKLGRHAGARTAAPLPQHEVYHSLPQILWSIPLPGAGDGHQVWQDTEDARGGCSCHRGAENRTAAGEVATHPQGGGHDQPWQESEKQQHASPHFALGSPSACKCSECGRTISACC